MINKLLKLLLKIEYLCGDISSVFDRARRKLKGLRWKIEDERNERKNNKCLNG